MMSSFRPQRPWAGQGPQGMHGGSRGQVNSAHSSSTSEIDAKLDRLFRELEELRREIRR